MKAISIKSNKQKNLNNFMIRAWILKKLYIQKKINFSLFPIFRILLISKINLMIIRCHLLNNNNSMKINKKTNSKYLSHKNKKINSKINSLNKKVLLITTKWKNNYKTQWFRQNYNNNLVSIILWIMSIKVFIKIYLNSCKKMLINKLISSLKKISLHR